MKSRQYDLRHLDQHAVIQINDTHPALIIPELVRILTTTKAMPLDEAIRVVERTCAYTNHTILAEALETWPMSAMEKVVPQLVPILRELDRRVKEKFSDKALWIIDGNDVIHMAYLAIHYGFSVNGVAEIHTQILEEEELHRFYEIYPYKFSNKTNGITFRRWLLSCNHELADFISAKINDAYKRDAEKLEGLLAFQDDPETLQTLDEIRMRNKMALAEYIEGAEDVALDPYGIFDIQIKRLHEYKRQQMNALYIIHKYLEVRSGKRPKRPLNFIFGGKAAPAYVLAKDVIHLLLVLADIINNDPDVNSVLHMVFVSNYNVSYAEKLIPACDVSEQISLATKEASGTSNMKFMLNGAVTLGTADGANVEIRNLVGDGNCYIFGIGKDEVLRHQAKHDYDPRKIYEKSPVVKEAVDFITGPQCLEVGHRENLERLRDALLTEDTFMTLIDLEDYIRVKDRCFADYEDRMKWNRMSLVNIAKSGYFSSDRAVSEYERDIWKLQTP